MHGNIDERPQVLSHAIAHNEHVRTRINNARWMVVTAIDLQPFDAELICL